MRALTVLVLLAAPLAAGQTLHAAYAQPEETSGARLNIEAAYILIEEHHWVRAVDTPDNTHGAALLGMVSEYFNATLTITSRPGDAHSISLLPLEDAPVNGTLEPRAHNQTSYADTVPGMAKPMVRPVEGSCIDAGPFALETAGDFQGTIFGYQLVIQHDGGTRYINSGYYGPTWAQHVPAAYNALTVEYTATNATVLMESWTANAAAYHGQCRSKPAATLDENVLDLAAAHTMQAEAMPAMAAQPTPPAAAGHDVWPAILAAVGLALLIAPRRRMANAAFRRGHYPAALALAAFSFGRQAAILRARSLDGCRLHALAARAFARLHAKTGLPDHADRAAIAYALAGKGPEAARWLLLADAQNGGILRRMRESHFERVAHDAVFTAAVRRIAGLSEPVA